MNILSSFEALLLDSCFSPNTNLEYGKEKAKKQTAEMKLHDEHNCLSLITNQIIKVGK
jgi:hypothetical protein